MPSLGVQRRGLRPDTGPARPACRTTLLLGDKPTSLAYEQWVEVVLSSRAHRRPKLRSRLQAKAARGMKRYPGHAGLRVLRAQLGR